MKIADITYFDGAVTLKGVVACAANNTERRPGILVVHEGWGLAEHAIERARMIAGLGYVAVAADMFGDRHQIAGAAEATKVIGDLRSDPPRLRARALAALEVLAGLSQVDETRLGAIGFCFGGSTVLELARAGADIRGGVSFHGALDTTATAQRGAGRASILVCR